MREKTYGEDIGLRKSRVCAINEGIVGIIESLNRLESLVTDIAGMVEQPSVGSNQKEPKEPEPIAYLIGKLPDFHKQVIYRIEEIESRLWDAFV